MPNNCYNYLEVVDGDITLLEPYLKHVQTDFGTETTPDFQKIIPMPEELKGTTSPSNTPNWYDWCCDNWGTKWNAYDGQSVGEHDAGIGFYTAWGPPTPVIVELAKKVGQTLRMVYDEPGMDFCGELIAEPDGTYNDSIYEPRSEAPDHLKDDLMIEEEEELDEQY